MIFKKANNNLPDMVGYLGIYRPYWASRGVRNPDFDEWSNLILDLKNRKNIAMNNVIRLIEPLIGEDFAIAIVPSHQPGDQASGMCIVARTLIGRKRLIDATGCLVRKHEIPKLSSGGNRSIQTQFNSIVVNNDRVITYREVLLLDDVTTTGNSLYACKQLLTQAGAKVVQCLAVSKTFGNWCPENDNRPNGILKFANF